MVSSLSSSSSKRSRVLSCGNSIASCLVDGCASDLSKCREYHRRHKVCEVHSKTATVVVRGREQRFCQQCSRFHLLVEFDDVKRSCRKRLEGHNRRRRKPQLRSLNFETYMTDQQGTEFTAYPQTFVATTLKSNWSPIFKAEDIPLGTHGSTDHHHLLDEYVNYEHFPVSSRGSIYKDDKAFPSVQENVFISDCAHSFLSSPRAQNAAYGGHGSSIPQPLTTSTKFDGILNCQSGHGNLGIVAISDGNAADFNCHGLFHVVGEGSSDGDHPSLNFSWQ